MAIAHVNGGQRSCGATTVVQGQDFVMVDGELWAVDNDPDTHGGGGLITSHSWLTINGKGVIVKDDSAQTDNLLHPNPKATDGDALIDVE